MNINNELELNNICKSFGSLNVLNEISISIKKGEFVTILGPSGCGKTTLLRVIAGLEKQDKGTVFFKKFDITDYPISKRGFGIVFQSYALFPNLNIEKNISYGMKNTSNEEKSRQVKEMLELVGLSGIESMYPSQLSGGMQQRVALARSLAVQPGLMLLDEPLSALDAKVRVKLRAEICRIQKKLDLTTIMVTHDQEEALTMADKIVVLYNGKIMQFDTPFNLYNSPANKFVADFIGHMNFLDNWTISDNGIIKPDPDSGKTLAFRPEDFEIASEDTDGAVTGEIEYMEFKGSYYRATIKIKDETTNNTVDIDFQPRQVKKAGLEVGRLFSFKIPASKIHVFEKTDSDKEEL